MRAALLALVLVVAGAVPASADGPDAGAYAARLRDARAMLQVARQASGTARETARRGAEELVRRTTAVRLPDGSLLQHSDAAIADRIARGEIDRALADLDAALALADVAARGYSGERADASLREQLDRQQLRTSGLSPNAVARAIAERLFGWAPRPDLGLAVPALALIGVALALVLVALVARGSRERLRAEAILPTGRGSARREPAEQLRRADAAARGGDARAAIHALYLYVLGSLAERDVLPADPALTDRELLARAAAAPHVRELRELFGMHETIWFGLRDAEPADAARARALAVRVAG